MSVNLPTRAKRAASAPARIGAIGIAPPAWAAELFESDVYRDATDLEGADISVLESTDFRMVRARMSDARDLSPAEFEAATVAAYTAIAREIRKSPIRHPVRLWNYIPDIHRPSGQGIDRYMVFNAGRFAACRRWLADGDVLQSFERNLPTASGIGHGGSDLIIDALAHRSPGDAVENPRQIPSYRYAKRYGPRPPCFSRATLLDDGRLLVGGTASILGEDSAHEDNLANQIEETLENLATLIRAAAGKTSRPAKKRSKPVELNQLEELRVYHPRGSDHQTIQNALRSAFSPAVRIEWMAAELCRRELLVEIEGVARINRNV